MIGADTLGHSARIASLEAAIRAVSAAGFEAARDAELDPEGETVTLSAESWAAYRKATIAAGWAIGVAHPACPAALQGQNGSGA